MGKEVNFGKLLHGGDYNPEQWLDYPEILEQDLAYFKKARINEGFAWHVFPGIFRAGGRSFPSGMVKEVIEPPVRKRNCGYAFHADGGKTALDGTEISGSTPHGCDAAEKSVRRAS